MQLPPKSPAAFRPMQLRSRPSAKDPAYEEVAIPSWLATFAVDFSGVPGLSKPNQDVANVISLDLDRVAS